MSASVTWYRMTPATAPKSWRARFGDFGIDSEGDIWIPTEIVGPAMAVIISAGSDGTPMRRGPGGHLFVPIDWAIEGYGSRRNEEFVRLRSLIRGAHPEARQDAAAKGDGFPYPIPPTEIQRTAPHLVAWFRSNVPGLSKTEARRAARLLQEVEDSTGVSRRHKRMGEWVEKMKQRGHWKKRT